MDELIAMSPAEAVTESDVWTRWRVLRRMLVVTLISLALDAAFWFTADFRTFTPPCEGPASERLYFAGVTASGPIVMCIINRWNLGGWLNAVFLAALVFGMATPALVRPSGFVARKFAYLSVLLWFFFGFCGAGLRIT